MHKNFTFIEGDIREYNTCLNSTKGVDYVLHQAAWGSVPRSIEMPLEYEEINVKGTLNMLEASKINKVKKFVYASSSSVYGDDPNLPKIEGKEGNTLSPYALTKKTNEEYARLYSDLYNLDTYGLRYFNVFGEKQDSNGAYAAVIPKFIKQLINNEQPTINGDGKHSRDFTYIKNVVEANLKACQIPSKYSGEVFNIAYGDKIQIIELYDHISRILKKDIKPIFGHDRKGDVAHSSANINKAKEIIKYTPTWSFEQGIKTTIDWYLKTH
jgi:UDP-N-acetylglucosamine 4-epimerase